MNSDRLDRSGLPDFEHHVDLALIIAHTGRVLIYVAFGIVFWRSQWLHKVLGNAVVYSLSVLVIIYALFRAWRVWRMFQSYRKQK